MRSLERAEKLLDLASETGVNIDLVELDVGDDESVRLGFEKIFELTGRVDVLVSNAGVGGNSVVEESTSEAFLDVFNINLCGVTAAGMTHATDALEVAKIIEHAITTDEPRVRYPVSWCSPEMSPLHDRFDEEDWLALGRTDDDAEYAERFTQVFGVQI